MLRRNQLSHESEEFGAPSALQSRDNEEPSGETENDPGRDEREEWREERRDNDEEPTDCSEEQDRQGWPMELVMDALDVENDF